MIQFKENASVIYTDLDGRKIDTYVIFDTDEVTGLTQINHENLRVPAESLTLHAKTICDYHMPLADAFSFELLSKLKAKYLEIDNQRKTLSMEPKAKSKVTYTLAKAS